MTDVDPRTLTVAEIVARLKGLQRTFDSGAWEAASVFAMLAESKRLHAELRSRGLTDLKIEWLLCDQPMA